MKKKTTNKKLSSQLLKIFLLIILIFLCIGQTKAYDITKETDIGGSTLVVYKSTCKNADSLLTPYLINNQQTLTCPYEKPTTHITPSFGDKYLDFVKATSYFSSHTTQSSYFFSERGIAIPKNTTKTDKIYIYFHGRDWWEHTPIKVCKDYNMCEHATQLKAPIILPQGINIGSQKQAPTAYEFKCLFDEALQVLKDKNVAADNAKVIVSGHSAGGNFAEKFVLRGQTGGKPIAATLFLDASYSPWALTAASHSNSGKVFIYYKKCDSQTSAGAKETWQAYKEKTKVLAYKTCNHVAVAKNCYYDHLTADNCIGEASVPAGIENTFEKIDIGEATGVTPPATPATVVPTGQTVDEIQTLIAKPVTKINIPGLNFSEPKAVEEDSGVYLYLPFIGEYLAAFYKWAIAALGVLAVVMIMNHGFAWSISGGSPEKITTAKKRIGEALIGLLIAVGSYTLLYTINPNLVEFKSLKVLYVKKELIDVVGDSTVDLTPIDLAQSGQGTANVPYFSQRGNQTPFGACGTIATSGCGPTSLAMVLKFLGKNVDPTTMAQEWAQRGYRKCPDPPPKPPKCDTCKNEGHGRMFSDAEFLKKYNLKSTSLGTDKEKILEALRAKKPLIVSVKKSIFTSADHIIVLTGVNSDGSISVNDPNKQAYCSDGATSCAADKQTIKPNAVPANFIFPLLKAATLLETK